MTTQRLPGFKSIVYRVFLVLFTSYSEIEFYLKELIIISYFNFILSLFTIQITLKHFEKTMKFEEKLNFMRRRESIIWIFDENNKINYLKCLLTFYKSWSFKSHKICFSHSMLWIFHRKLDKNFVKMPLLFNETWILIFSRFHREISHYFFSVILLLIEKVKEKIKLFEWE